MLIFTQNTPKKLRSKDWRRAVGEKLRFSFSEKKLEERLSKLKSTNNALVVICNQAKRSVVSNERAVVRRRSQLAETNIRRYQAVGKISRQVYEVLSRSCTKHTDHVAHFCVEVEHITFEGDLFVQAKFSMAFTHQNLNRLALHSEPVWFLMESIIDERVGEPARAWSNVDRPGIRGRQAHDQALQAGAGGSVT